MLRVYINFKRIIKGLLLVDYKNMKVIEGLLHEIISSIIIIIIIIITCSTLNKEFQ